ncbi:MAG: methyltransferase domain-containing protein [Chitinophagales bacterium]|nr:methyltransferase domain-containing protein [Chitinophagales bacterium]
MNANKALWEKVTSPSWLKPCGAELVAKLGVTKGLNVLDLECGDGTTAIPADQLGPNVLGVDIARNLVEAENIRAKNEGLTNCTFQEGDATDLHELKDQTIIKTRKLWNRN